jgi:hypothetical protein
VADGIVDGEFVATAAGMPGRTPEAEVQAFFHLRIDFREPILNPQLLVLELNHRFPLSRLKRSSSYSYYFQPPPENVQKNYHNSREVHDKILAQRF